MKKLFETLIIQADINYEIIIVDNASTNQAPANQFVTLEQNNIPYQFIKHPENTGFATACNLGAHLAQGEYLLFCNPDIEIAKNSLAKFVDSYINNKVDILSCAQKNSQNIIKSACGSFPNMTRFIPILGGLFKQKNTITSPNIVNVDWVSGSVVLMSQKIYQQLKGWDEDYFMFMEDVDLCNRAHKAGMTVAVDNGIVWLHHHGLSSQSNIKDRVRSKTAAISSKHTYVSKHFNSIQKPMTHVFIFLKYMPELLVGAILSILWPAKELVCRRHILYQYSKYLLNKH